MQTARVLTPQIQLSGAMKPIVRLGKTYEPALERQKIDQIKSLLRYLTVDEILNPLFGSTEAHNALGRILDKDYGLADTDRVVGRRDAIENLFRYYDKGKAGTLDTIEETLVRENTALLYLTLPHCGKDYGLVRIALTEIFELADATKRSFLNDLQYLPAGEHPPIWWYKQR